MNIRSWSESSGAMLVPSTFTGWYKKTIITRARPMAIRRSRVQTRISLRKECSGTDRSGAAAEPGSSLLTLDVIWAAFTTEEDAGTGVSGAVEVAGCFSSILPILRCLVFIAWPSRPAPDAFWGRVRSAEGESDLLHRLRFVAWRTSLLVLARHLAILADVARDSFKPKEFIGFAPTQSGVSAKFSDASAVTTAVSVRRIKRPSEAWLNPYLDAAPNSSSVQPPSGPMARTAMAVRWPCRIFRRGEADARSESITRKPSFRGAKATSGFAKTSRTGTRTRRDCCEASSRIFFQRSTRLAPAASKAFSLRSAASGTILLIPNSVAFSMAHSKASNFTTASSSVTSRLG